MWNRFDPSPSLPGELATGTVEHHPMGSVDHPGTVGSSGDGGSASSGLQKAQCTNSAPGTVKPSGARFGVYVLPESVTTLGGATTSVLPPGTVTSHGAARSSSSERQVLSLVHHRGGACTLLFPPPSVDIHVIALESTSIFLTITT